MEFSLKGFDVALKPEDPLRDSLNSKTISPTDVVDNCQLRNGNFY